MATNRHSIRSATMAAVLTVVVLIAAACSSGTTDVAAPAPAPEPVVAATSTPPPTQEPPSEEPATQEPPTQESPTEEPVTSLPFVEDEQSADDGAWLLAGYGDVYTLDGGAVTGWFQPAGGHCVEIPADQRPAELSPQPIGDGFATVDVGQTYLLQRVELPAACVDIADEVPPAAPIEAFVDLMDRYYPFFAERGIDWETARLELLDTATTVATTDEAAAAVGDFIEVLGDGHTSITTNLGTVGATPDRERTNWGAEGPQIEAYLGETFEIRARDGIIFGQLTDDVGYLRLVRTQAFSGTAVGPAADNQAEVEVFDAAIDDALTALAGTSKLIIDLRSNGGGNGAHGRELAGRVIDEPTDVFTYAAAGVPESLQTVTIQPSNGVHYDGEVVVLVDGLTGSAAEGAAGALSVLGATVIGSETLGIWSEINIWTLPGGYTLHFSNEIWRTLDGTLLEVAGVPLDVEVDPDDALLAALTEDEIAQLTESAPPTDRTGSAEDEAAVANLVANFTEGCSDAVVEAAAELADQAAAICEQVFVDAVEAEGPELADQLLSGEVDPGEVMAPYLEAALAGS